MRETGEDQGSRRVRRFVLLGVAAAFLLVQAQASHAAVAVSGGAAAESASAETATSESGAVLCRSSGESGAGPCFFIAVTVVGSNAGRVESTADPAGTKVVCPPAGAYGCTVPEWFIWALDVENPFIDFSAIPGTGSFSGWDNCPHVLPPPNPNPQGAAGRCRIYANELDDVNYQTCLTAGFSPATQTVGECVPGTPAPVGDPVLVTKHGTGTGTVQSTSTADPPVQEINCGSRCSVVYPVGTAVTLFASVVEHPNSTFAGWSGVGHNCTGTGACQIAVSGQTITARATFNLVGPPPPPPVLNAVLIGKPAKTTRKKQATFTWGAKRNKKFKTPFQSQCKLNKQAWKKCAPGKTYKKLKPRTHTFRVRVRDNLNKKWDPTPAVWKWRIRK